MNPDRIRPDNSQDQPKPGLYMLRAPGEWRPVAVWRDIENEIKVLEDVDLVCADRMQFVWAACREYPIDQVQYAKLLFGERFYRERAHND